MHRFLLTDFTLSPGGTIALPDRVAHQIRSVLRLQVGEQVILLDNSGREYLCSIAESSREEVFVTVEASQQGKRDTELEVILCQGLLKSARFEWILEKGTELGVTSFAPMTCQRSLAGLENAGQQKLQRWQRIIAEATEQCGRSRIPTLLPIREFHQVLDQLPTDAALFIPWEEEKAVLLKTALRRLHIEHPEIQKVALLIGPEGGFAQKEIAQAQERRVTSVSLGKRILRAETAALASVANVLYELEEEQA